MNGPLMWAGFVVLVFVLLAIDLFVFNKEAHEVKISEALWLSLFWISLALFFNAGLAYFEGGKKGMEFLAGYLIEKSLSVDNLFVFIIIFKYFNIEGKYQHKILFWGILGALVLRALFILTGVALIQKFEWIIYVFGAFLVYTGVKLVTSGETEMDPSKNPVIRLLKNFMPISHEPHNGKFFTIINGRRMATTLFVALLVVETTDVVFAIDSIPAILAISTDPFIVFSSNVFAILGLRALYFALAGIISLFHYLKYGLAVVLSFVGIKMLISHYYKIPIGIALGIVGGTLVLSMLASVVFPEKKAAN